MISTQVHGYGAAGAALVSGGIDKCIFVGSPEVGKIVMETASKTLTPVVLELGGKDPFVVCDDCSASDLDRISQIALRGVFQSMGQNCAGPERFFVADAVYAGFCSRVGAAAARLARGGEAPPPCSQRAACVQAQSRHASSAARRSTTQRSTAGPSPWAGGRWGTTRPACLPPADTSVDASLDTP